MGGPIRCHPSPVSQTSTACILTVSANSSCGRVAPLAVSLAIKAVAIAAVFPGWLTLWLAVLGDMGASVLVTLNWMRMLATRPIPRPEDPK